jgi:hypothetical protein
MAKFSKSGFAILHRQCVVITTLIVLLLVPLLSNSSPRESDKVSGMVITENTPWVISEVQPEPVRRALEDVKSDWYKVFGHPPVILDKLPSTYKGPVIYIGQKGAWRDSMIKEVFPGPESFILRIQKDDGGREALVATGADMRGSIYAAYALSEEILGVDPWYYWVDKEPLKRNSINIPAGFNTKADPPTFKYRGWFMNDEDLLNKFAPDPLRENVFSLEMYDHIYETLLRLRGNMVVPGTYAFPDERCQELAARRGLILNMHHVFVLGLNTYRWPKDVPLSYNKSPRMMETYWQTCINAYKDYEVVWTVGYRGRLDMPFWSDEPGLKTPEARGQMISKVIAKQVEMIRKVQPNAAIIANMWSEGAELYHQGHIKLPEGVTLVWPDGGEGIIRDNGKVQAGQGIYYHTAMLSMYHNQLSEMVNPGRIYNQIGRFVRAGATDYFLDNVSDIRAVPLSTDCAMKMAWNAKPYLDNTDEQNMEFFLRDWSQRQFGSELASKIVPVYKKYFAIPYMGGSVRQGENNLQSRLQHLDIEAAPLIAKGQPLSEKALKLCQELLKLSTENRDYLTDLLKQARPILGKIPGERKNFYQSHVLTQIEIHLQSLLMGESYCKSILAYKSENTSLAISQAEKALLACNDLFSALHKAEYGKWSRWYMGETFVGLNVSYDMIRVMLARLGNKPIPPVRATRPFKSMYEWVNNYYETMYDYQEPFLKNFPLLYPKK